MNKNVPLNISMPVILVSDRLGLFWKCFAVEEFIFNMSRQSEFQLFPSLWLAGTSVAKSEKGAVCPADPPCKWEGAVVQWPRLITTKQLQTHSTTAIGAQPYSQTRGQALQCGEATGGPLCSSLPSTHSHAMRPLLQPSTPAASSTSLAEIAGWQGNHVCKYDRTDKEMSRSLFS